MIRIELTSIFVDDQAAAEEFYTGVLGFETVTDAPTGDYRWLTVRSPAQPDGPELLLEPAEHPAVGPFRDALVEDGIPATQLAVDDVRAEHARLVERGVRFTQEPLDVGEGVTTAVFDDTCGNLVQLASTT